MTDREDEYDRDQEIVMIVISEDVLNAATEAFHAALDRHLSTEIHGRDGDWVDGSAEAIAEALLMDGWQPPPSHQ